LQSQPFIEWSLALEGAKLASRNAQRLADDALQLHKIQSLTAFSVSILAWEETNKAGLLLKAYVEKNNISKTQWHDKFNNHQRKLDAYPEYVEILYPNIGGRPAIQAAEANARLTGLGRELDLQKQHFGFYTDFGEQTGHWHSPINLNVQNVEYAIWLANHYATISMITCKRIDEIIGELESKAEC
jgi:AbiV family abortive infection protein